MAEPWIRVHANLADRPVVFRAAKALGVTKAEAIGLLVSFWGRVSQHAPNGSVSQFEDAQLEDWAGWFAAGRRKAGAFAAFIRANHLDTEGRVNEWDDYAGALEEQRRQARDRKRKSRGRHGDGHSDIGVTSSPTIRDDTKRDEKNGGGGISAAVELAADQSQSPVSDPELTALYLCIWANNAAAEKWGERAKANPYTPNQCEAMADELRGLSVPWQVARASIFAQCRGSNNPEPPGGPSYFLRGIKRRWQQEQARIAAEAVPEVPAIEIIARGGPSRPPTSGGERPSIGKRAFDTTLAAIEDIA